MFPKSFRRTRPGNRSRLATATAPGSLQACNRNRSRLAPGLQPQPLQARSGSLQAFCIYKGIRPGRLQVRQAPHLHELAPRPVPGNHQIKVGGLADLAPSPGNKVRTVVAFATTELPPVAERSQQRDIAVAAQAADRHAHLQARRIPRTLAIATASARKLRTRCGGSWAGEARAA